jgi:hypothetical protein
LSHHCSTRRALHHRPCTAQAGTLDVLVGGDGGRAGVCVMTTLPHTCTRTRTRRHSHPTISCTLTHVSPTLTLAPTSDTHSITLHRCIRVSMTVRLPVDPTPSEQRQPLEVSHAFQVTHSHSTHHTRMHTHAHTHTHAHPRLSPPPSPHCSHIRAHASVSSVRAPTSLCSVYSLPIRWERVG